MSYLLWLACKSHDPPIISEATSKLNVSFLVGFETEFVLLTSTHPVIPVNGVGYSYSSHLLAGAKETEALEDMVRALEAAHIQVFMYHSEAAPGQVSFLIVALNNGY